jgi:hypothetical protein
MMLYPMDSGSVNRPSTTRPTDGPVWAVQRIARDYLHIEEGLRPSYPAKRSKKKCPKGLRKRVFKAFKTCEYCGGNPHVRGGGRVSWPTVDRIAASGNYEPSNVTLACLLCNSLKGTSEFIGPVRTLQIMEGGHVSTRS